ncbi:MAG: DUF4276 family protein [Syntrophobacteraceae bacterium]|nr:DUF4276 family protein [Syntrophobacteraceae bacterium]
MTARLLIHVEGQTEETFVNEILRPHLYAFGYAHIGARLLGNARQRSRRGGIRPWNAARHDILRHLKEDTGCLATTMVDYYGLPATGAKAWPGREKASGSPGVQKAASIEMALMEDIRQEMGPGFGRFIPFVIMHEFEGLLFSDCEGFARGIERPELAGEFQSIRSRFSSPEEINDSTATHPSKRIEQLVPNYTKPLMGVLAVLEIGLAPIRWECPHFAEWLKRLGTWPAAFSRAGVTDG